MEPLKSTFEFTGYNFEGKKVHFHYKITTSSEELKFTETITLPGVSESDIPSGLQDQILHSLHLILGISYWKLFCSPEIIIKTKPLTKDQADFWNTVYTKGLGEFFYKNKIEFSGLIKFPFQESVSQNSIPFPRKNRSLVGIGGGKDSIVTSELLKKAVKDFSTFIIDTQHEHGIIHEIGKKIGTETLVIKREVDQKLFELNKRPDVYNGHIPISAIYAFIGVLLGALYDFKYIIVSNESSANFGNTEYLGETINHQWSKSFEFENLFQEYVSKYITPDIIYFSLLRPFSEMVILKEFTNYPRYFPHFSSCNRNYKIKTTENIPSNWCGECPKCAFVFVIFAAFTSADDVESIFGDDLLNKESLMKTYKELLGIEGVKPFECVGTPEEVKLAFYMLYKKGEYKDSLVMQMFEKEVVPEDLDVEELKTDVFKSGEHSVPEEFRDILL